MADRCSFNAPPVATPEMVQAALELVWEDSESHDELVRNIWQAMAAVAPSAEPSPRAQALEEGAILEALDECETYFDNLSDADHDETGFVANKEMRLLISVRAAIRALSSQSVSDRLPQDVINLVIAAREAFDTGVLPDEEEHNLDKALDPFGERVPYENDPDARPASPEVSG